MKSPDADAGFPAALTGGVLAGIAISVLVGLAGGIAVGGLGAGTAYTALAAGIVCMLVAVVSMRGKIEGSPVTPWGWVVLAVFGLACLRAYFWLVVESGNELRVLSPHNLGDLALHLHFTRFLAGGVPLWPESPILAGEALRYPAGMNLFNAMLTLVGMDVMRGFLLTGVAGCALLGVCLWRWGRAFGVAAFLFSGGLAGFAFFQTWELQDYQTELAWKNLFLTSWVTQRGLLFALPAGLFLLDVWRRMARGEAAGVAIWVQVLLYACMPLFNIHAFLYLSLQLLVLFCLVPGARRTCLLIVGAALIPASVFVWLVTDGFLAAGGMGWLPGWMQGEAGVGFWVENFGLALPLGAALAVAVWWSKDPAARPFVWTACGVFLLCCFVRFTAWEWDNTKLMLWSWVAAAPFLWDELLRRLRLAARVAVCAVLFFSGAVALVGGLDGRHGYFLASRPELAEVAAVLAKTPPGARFAAAPEYNHPLLLLGQPVAVGYHGHLWSHGYAYEDKARAVERLFLQADPDAASELGVDAIFVGRREAETWPELRVNALRAMGRVVEGRGFFVVVLN